MLQLRLLKARYTSFYDGGRPPSRTAFMRIWSPPEMPHLPRCIDHENVADLYAVPFHMYTLFVSCAM
jgi:hypothetical protein